MQILIIFIIISYINVLLTPENVKCLFNDAIKHVYLKISTAIRRERDFYDVKMSPISN